MLNSPSQYLPHAGRMCLVDSILEVRKNSISCEVNITENNIFYEPAIGGIHSWVGIELMAQAIGIYANYQSNPAEKPKIGFLISVRKFSTTLPYFKLYDKLTIIADNEYSENGVGVFQGKILLNNQEVAKARLTVLEPNEKIL